MQENKLENFFKGNKPKIIIWIVVVIVIIAIGYYSTIAYLQWKIKTSYETLQTECAKISENFTKEMQKDVSNIKYTQTSHYSTNLSKCYTLIHGEGIIEVGTTDILIDLSASKDVAICESHSTAPEIDYCKYNESKSAYNINDFNNFIKSYMENK
ncbi:MAG: hypothetical protein WC711_02850 [Candidatus Staskawiczbacteria bacterium]|jgi:hypothetical protein